MSSPISNETWMGYLFSHMLSLPWRQPAAPHAAPAAAWGTGSHPQHPGTAAREKNNLRH